MTEILLLANVFKNFKNICIENYKLDPAHYCHGKFHYAELIKHEELEMYRDGIGDNSLSAAAACFFTVSPGVHGARMTSLAEWRLPEDPPSMTSSSGGGIGWVI